MLASEHVCLMLSLLGCLYLVRQRPRLCHRHSHRRNRTRQHEMAACHTVVDSTSGLQERTEDLWLCLGMSGRNSWVFAKVKNQRRRSIWIRSIRTLGAMVANRLFAGLAKRRISIAGHEQVPTVGHLFDTTVLPCSIFTVAWIQY